jgi:DNA polymerase elongation subunit (family B)
MESFTTFVYSWHADEEGVIHMFGMSPENKTIHVEVPDFTPYTYMELPIGIEWTDMRRNAILSSIKEFPLEIQPVTKSFMNKQKLYYANVTKNPNYDQEMKVFENKETKEPKPEKYKYKTYPYLFLAFQTREATLGFIKKMSYGTYIPSLGRKIKFKFHEQDASSFLQLSTCRNIPMTGWINGKGKSYEGINKFASTDFSFRTSWKDLDPCKDPSILQMVPCPKILMFDCEANSDNIATMPKNRPNDKIFQISLAVMIHGSSSIEKHLLSLGNPSQAGVGEGIKIHEYKNEGDLLVGFTQLIHQINPQIIGGYNILGWDFSYMIQRAKLLGVFTEFTKMGYLMGVQSKEKKISWSSSAFNAQNFIFLDIVGRLVIDMLPIIKKDFKFNKYDLGSVSTEILGQTKDPLTHKGIFKCYRIFSPESLALCGKYCCQDANVTLLLFDKLKTWIGSCQMASIFKVPIIDLYTQGQQVKLYAQVYQNVLNKNFVVEKDGYICEEDESYTGAIVLEPTPGLYEDVITFDFASLYPSVIIAGNICYSTLVNDLTIPDSDCNVFEWSDHVNCEHDTQKRTSKEHVLCCQRKYRFLKSPRGVLPSLLIDLISARKSTKKELESVESKIKEEKDIERKKALSMYATVLDMRQLAIKVISNSFYGGMGVRRGKLPFMPGAMVTTAGGREAILKAQKLLNQKCPHRDIYGDTDSLMVTMDEIKSFKNTEGKTDYKKLEEYANQISAEISKEFPPPMKLEFENISKKFFILTKKRYMAELTNGKYKKRGVMVSRRDNASACRFIYEFMLKGIFAEKTQQIMEIEVLDLLNDLYSHKFATKEYCITKSIKEIDQYKIKPPDKDPLKRAKQFANKFLDPAVHTDVDYLLRALPAHVQLAERMRRRGMIVEPGSRLEYIITVSGGSKGKIWQKIESADYYKEHSDMIRLDMNYYCKSLVNPGDQVLFTMYKKKDFFKEQYSFRLLKADCLKELLRLFNTRIELTD